MRLLILDDADQVAEWAATLVAKRIRTFKPTPDRHFVLGLPTGGTPLKMYQKLIQLYKEGKVSFKYVTSFNMDEYVGIPYNHPGSYHHYMFENFFQHIDIDPSNAHLLDGNATDLDAECRLYEENIKRAGGINLFVGGMGPDGHIAFNEPGSSMTSRTRVKSLAYDTVAANARFFGGDIDAVPKQALTVGVGTVMDGKELLILVTGAAKAIALHNVVECGINHMWTASIIQQHPAASIVCDDDATLELKVKTVNYFKSLKAVNMKLVED